ncbi:MAG: serine/threonine-protein kinase [Kofleriaceae bacterium]
MPAEDLDRYELGEAIGRGGMGEVRDALDRQIGRRVAIKTIRNHAPSERTVTRFLREAQIQGRLEHPAIPAVHEVGKDREGRPFFVMKKLAGTTLTRVLSKPDVRTTRQRPLHAFVDVCLAVEFAHVHGVVHRDLKPDNIVLGDFGEVYVLDWGVAKVVGEPDTFDDLAADQLETRAGTVLGTPGYMAPEQAHADPDIDGRADVFSLGVVLREILEREADSPPELQLLSEQATRPDRESRLPDARSLAEGVQQYLDGDRDLLLRRALARTHLALARTAFAQDQRSVAMREAGRALALDPQLAEAGDLITGLMLEPPRETPPELERELHADALQRTRASTSGALVGMLAFVGMLVALGFLPSNLTKVDARTALVVVVCFVFALALRAVKRTGAVNPWWLATGCAGIIVIVARLFSPTLVAPGIAAVVASALATNPVLGSRQAAVGLWGLMSAAVLVPLAAERVGWLSATMEPVIGTGILLHTPLLASAPTSAAMRGALFVVVLVAAAVMVSYLVRRTDEQLRRRLHLQAWHLRQLFPPPDGAGPAIGTQNRD